MRTVESVSSDFKFSKSLETRLITYFQNSYDLEVSPGEAQLFLGSLARLYDALSEEPQTQARPSDSI